MSLLSVFNIYILASSCFTLKVSFFLHYFLFPVSVFFPVLITLTFVSFLSWFSSFSQPYVYIYNPVFCFACLFVFLVSGLVLGFCSQSNGDMMMLSPIKDSHVCLFCLLCLLGVLCLPFTVWQSDVCKCTTDNTVMFSDI